MTDTPYELTLLHKIANARRRLGQAETELAQAKDALQSTQEWNDFVLCRDTHKQLKKLLDETVNLTSDLTQLRLDLPDNQLNTDNLLDQVANLINHGALDSADVRCTAVNQATQ